MNFNFNEYSNRSLCEFKISLIHKLNFNDQSFREMIVDYHGVILHIFTKHQAILDLVRNLIPDLWIKNINHKTDINLFLYSIKDFSMSSNEWENEENHECWTLRSLNKEMAIQRDFVAEMSENNVHAIFNEEITDGLYNILRWFLPRELLKIGKIVLHSSCVITNQKASFFLGHSGYGKSTLASFAQDRLVLGDDMNILFAGGNKFYAQGAALGGMYNNKSILDQCFLVQGFYWLNKSSQNAIKKMDRVEACRKFISSCANIFWGEIDELNEEEIMRLSILIVNKYPFYNLFFSPGKEFWDYVRE